MLNSDVVKLVHISLDRKSKFGIWIENHVISIQGSVSFSSNTFSDIYGSTKFWYKFDDVISKFLLSYLINKFLWIDITLILVKK